MARCPVRWDGHPCRCTSAAPCRAVRRGSSPPSEPKRAAALGADLRDQQGLSDMDAPVTSFIHWSYANYPTLSLAIGQILVIPMLPLIISVAMYVWWGAQGHRLDARAMGPNRGPAGWRRPFADVFKAAVQGNHGSAVAPTDSLFYSAPLLALAPALAAPGGRYADGSSVAWSNANADLLYLLAADLAWRIRHHPRRLGVQPGTPSSAPCVPPPRWSYESRWAWRWCACSSAGSAQPVRHRQCPGGQQGTFRPWFWLPLLPMFVIYFISGTARPTACPSTWRKASRKSSPASTWSTPASAFAIFFLAEYANMIPISFWRRPVHGRLVSPFPAIRWLDCCRGPACTVVAVHQGLRVFVAFLWFRDVPALPLRPDHASGLEGVHRHRWLVAGLFAWFGVVTVGARGRP